MTDEPGAAKVQLTKGGRTHLSQGLFDDLNRDDLPAAYFRHMRHVGLAVAEAMAEKRRPMIEDDPDSWAGSAIDNLDHLDPEERWLVIGRLVEASGSSGDLGSIGAGPLENLFRAHGDQFVDRLRELVERDDRWTYAAANMYEMAAPAAAGLIRGIRDSRGPMWKEFSQELDANLGGESTSTMT
jgi:hypothetical protein